MLRRILQPKQYTSIRYPNWLLDAGAVAVIGTVGDSYYNAQVESLIGLYRAECTKHEGPWRGVDRRRPRARHPELGALVQPDPAAQQHRPRPSAGVRSRALPSHHLPAAAAGRTQSPLNAGRFTVSGQGSRPPMGRSSCPLDTCPGRPARLTLEERPNTARRDRYCRARIRAAPPTSRGCSW